MILANWAFQIADIYDALINERPYKSAMSGEQVIDILAEEVDKGWRDPELSAVFIDIVRQRHLDLELPYSMVDELGSDLFADIVWTGAVRR